MDVLQRQVDEYEHEIRNLKDFKSPKKGSQVIRTPRRSLTHSLTSVSDVPSATKAGLDDSVSNSLSLEATLFRPALQQALRDSYKWKAVATSSTMSQLPPLPVPFPLQDHRGRDDLLQLSTAIADARLQKASIKMVDLRNRDKTPRAQLLETRQACLATSRRLETQARRCLGQMTA